jgi:hypothetical protein
MRRASLPSSHNPGILFDGGESAPVGRPDFKPGWGCTAVPGRFDSCSLPPEGRVLTPIPMWLHCNSVAGLKRYPLANGVMRRYGWNTEKVGDDYYPDQRRPVLSN